MILDVSDMHCM